MKKLPSVLITGFIAGQRIRYFLLPERSKSAMIEEDLVKRGKVEREDFIPREHRHLAYSNRAIQIASNRSAAQPFLTAFMIQSLRLEENAHVLEIGTGSGYQTALLAEITREVNTLEPDPGLAAKAREELLKKDYGNINFKISEADEGWEEHGPYYAIISTLAFKDHPNQLFTQLRAG